MTTALPLPPISADVDLCEFRYMPLYIEQLKRSRAWLKCRRRPELAFYMLNLWTASWHERPAASLEDDDDVLADIARCDPARWDELKADALHGWVKCEDGRLYHPIVAERALEAWKGKIDQRLRTLKARIAALEKRLSAAVTDDDKAHIAGLLRGLRQDLSQIIERSDNSKKSVARSVTDPATRPVTETKGKGKRKRKGKGEGEGEGEGEEKKNGALGASSATPDDGTTRAAFDAFVAAARRHPKWPVPNSLTDKRRKALNARIKDAGGPDGFLAVLTKAEASRFICNDMAAWSLDWMLKPANFQKLADGNYDDRGASKSGGGKSEGFSW